MFPDYKKEEDNFWLSTQALKGASFKINTYDYEKEESILSSLSQKLENLDDKVTLTFNHFTRLKKALPFPHFRSSALFEKGFIEEENFISFSAPKSDIIELRHQTSRFKDKASVFPFEIFKKSELSQGFKVSSYGLRGAHTLIGVFKLVQVSGFSLTLENLCLLKEGLPAPFEIHLKFKKMSSLKTQAMLEKTAKQESTGHSQTSFTRYSHAQKALEETQVFGQNLFLMSFHIVLRRESEEELRKDLRLAREKLSSLGDFSTENIGAFPSLVSIFPGTKFHVPLIESEGRLKFYLPLVSRGSREPLVFYKNFIFHRANGSLDHFDPFSPQFNNFSGVIIGRSGKGKSVLTNLLLQSLSKRLLTKTLLIDVNGSFSRTVRELGGESFHFDLDKPSGLNPFKHLTNSKESLEIGVSFLESLLLEDDEIGVNYEVRMKLEQALSFYVKNTKKPDLKEFISMIKTDDNKLKLLQRWGKSSLNEHIFSGFLSDDIKSLNYYNFSKILTATKKDITRAVFSAVMAEFSFKLLKKEGQERLVFICDEVPFFIKTCFNSFKLLSKNVRKLNGSLILIAQSSSDLIVNKDTSLLDTSEFKILFSIDSTHFQERLGLTNNEVEIIKNLKTYPDRYSQFYLKDSNSGCVGFLVLSLHEKALVTTKAEDSQTVNEIRKLFCDLSYEKIQKILNVIQEERV